MIRNFTFLCFLLSFGSLHAQSLSQSVIGSSGAHYQTGSNSLSWTLGEPVINTLENGTVRLTQGFHQPYINVSTVEESPEAAGILVFPNPADELLNIEFGQPGNYSLRLFDVLGRQLRHAETLNSSFQLDLSEFASGNYLLGITTEKGISKTLKIQKIR